MNWIVVVAAVNVVASVAFWVIVARHAHDLAGTIWEMIGRFRLPPLLDDGRPRIFRVGV